MRWFVALCLMAGVFVQAWDVPQARGEDLCQLHRMLYDPDPKIRDKAVQGLKQHYDHIYVSTRGLAYALKYGETEEIRAGAADALQAIGASAHRAVPELAEALNDPSAKVRAKVAEALSQMGPFGKAAVPALAKALKDKDAHVRTRTAVALGLIVSDARVAVPALIDALADPDDAKGRAEGDVASAAVGAVQFRP